MALLDRLRSLVQRPANRPATWPWFTTLDGGASWPWFGTFTVAWFCTLDLPADCRPCARCGDQRPRAQLDRNLCVDCRRTCLACGTAQPLESFTDSRRTDDPPFFAGVCTVCRFKQWHCDQCKREFRRHGPSTSPRPLAFEQFTTDITDNRSPTRCDRHHVTRVCFRCLQRRPLMDLVRYTGEPGFGGVIENLCKDCKTLRPLTTHELDAIAAVLGSTAAATIDPTIPSADLTLGTTAHGTPVTITDTDRTRHVYLIGGTGSGKSVTLTNLATQDLKAGRGCTAIDPHGDLAQGLLARVPPEQFSRVVYFDPTDEDAPAFNLLATDFDPNKLTADLVATFKMFFGDSWGFQMEALLSNALLTLLLDRQHEPHTFADLRTLLVDDDYRRTIVDRCPDEIAQSFWKHEYKQMTKDAARPILTRLSSVLMAGSPLRRVLTNKDNALDVRAIMDGNGVLLVNLSKGALGDGPARLLGGLFVTAITQAALARQRIPENQRTPHTLYCDEFQNFADLPSTESILSEARKYQLRLVLAHQTMAQVNPRLMQNILGNVRTLVAFRVSPDDASKLARAMGRSVYVHPDTNQRFDLARDRHEKAQALAAITVTFPHAPTTHYLNTRGITVNISEFLTAATADPLTYRPPDARTRDGKTKPWKESSWPEARDFQNLPTCHAFTMRNVASSTCELRVPFPPPVPHPDNLDRWHERRTAELAPKTPATSPAPTQSENQRATMPQDRRSEPDSTQTPHRESTQSPKAPPDDFDEFLT